MPPATARTHGPVGESYQFVGLETSQLKRVRDGWGHRVDRLEEAQDSGHGWSSGDMTLAASSQWHTSRWDPWITPLDGETDRSLHGETHRSRLGRVAGRVPPPLVRGEEKIGGVGSRGCAVLHPWLHSWTPSGSLFGTVASSRWHGWV